MKSFVEFCNDIPEIHFDELTNIASSIDFDDISEELYNRCKLYRNLDFINEGDGVAPECLPLAMSLNNAIKEIFYKDEVTIIKPFKGNMPEKIISKFDFYKFIDSLDIEIKKSVNFHKDFKGDGEYDQNVSDDFWSE